MLPFTGKQCGTLVVAGLFTTLLSVAPGKAADTKAAVDARSLTAHVDQLLSQKLRAEAVRLAQPGGRHPG